MILFIILFTMGVGMITFSVGVDNEKETRILTEEEIESAKTADLVKNDNEAVMNLIENYNSAKLAGDADKFALYVNDEAKISKEELDAFNTYMEGYENVDCYVIDMPIEDNYVVYVYREYKMKDFDTLIPGVVRQYVCPDKNGNLVVYSGDVEDSIYDFIENTKENPEVEKLINMVNNKIEQLKEEDAKVKIFLDRLEEVVSEDTQDKPETTESAAPQTSEVPKASSIPSGEPVTSGTPATQPEASKKPESTKKPDASKQPNATKAA